MTRQSQIKIFELAKCSDVLRLLTKAGWRVKSQKGSHKKLVHDDFPDPIVFPDHGSKEIANGTMHAILKAAGIKR